MILSLALILLLQGVKDPEPSPGHPVLLPTEFIENRFNVVPVTTSGHRLRLFTDSAGGHNLVTEVAEELKLPIAEGESKSAPRTAPYPTFRPDAFIPSAISARFRLFSRKVTDEEFGPGYDGMLGQQWFAGRVWTFDYPAKHLYWRAPGDLPEHSPEHEVRLGFKTGANGERLTNFARIPVTVDGETLSFTVDTGATDVLGPEVLKAIGDGRPADRATSFLAQSIYEKWHAKHADWRVIPMKTGSGSAMIEVPKVTLGGYEVGPVWFSVEPDRTFHQYMAQWTDQPTEGSIGGSAFKYFRMTIDWPNAVGVFEKP